jgi:hypothetical protein
MKGEEMTIEEERNYWRNVACYLASCHAATAEHDGLMSTTSKSRRKRFAAICKTCSKALQPEKGGFWPHNSTDTKVVIERCEDAITSLGFEAAQL